MKDTRKEADDFSVGGEGGRGERCLLEGEEGGMSV